MQNGATIHIEENALANFSYYGLKEKYKNNVRHWSRHDMLLEINIAMFDYDDIPDTVNDEFIELYLETFGECAIWETKDGYAVTICGRAGTPNPNGLGKDLICTTFNGENVVFKDFENPTSDDYGKVVRFKNNKLGTPDYYLSVTGDIMADLDTSIKQIVINARYSPLAVAKNKKIADMISESYKNIENGALHTVATEGGLIDGLDDDRKPVEVLQIADPTIADKIQYLTKAQEDIMRQYYNYYGLDMAGGTKLAQQTVEEINAGNVSSMVTPNVRLAHRQKAIEECNIKFGWNATVNFSKCWQIEQDKIEFDPEETNQESDEEVLSTKQESEGDENA